MTRVEREGAGEREGRRARFVRRQGSADPAIHLGERGVEMEVPPLEDRRLGQLPPMDGG